METIENSEEFNKIYNEISVISRSKPDDKYALVLGLMERGHVVAVTGDGNKFIF